MSNNQSPITKLHLITNTQYSITKRKDDVKRGLQDAKLGMTKSIALRLGIRSLGIDY